MIGYLLFSAIKREVTKGVKKGSVQVLTADDSATNAQRTLSLSLL